MSIFNWLGTTRNILTFITSYITYHAKKTTTTTLQCLEL